MLAQMPSLSFETAASLAEKVLVSEPTVGRFCRTLGYKSLLAVAEKPRRVLQPFPHLFNEGQPTTPHPPAAPAHLRGEAAIARS